MSENAQEFCGDFVEEKITITFNKVPTDFYLVELDGDQRDEYLNAIGKRMGGTGADRSVKDFKGMLLDLLIPCLRDADKKPLSREVVRKWPAKLQNDLFEKCQKMNGLDKKANAEAKND